MSATGAIAENSGEAEVSEPGVVISVEDAMLVGTGVVVPVLGIAEYPGTGLTTAAIGVPKGSNVSPGASVIVMEGIEICS